MYLSMYQRSPIDWTRPNYVIAAQLGTTPKGVSNVRRRFGAPRIRPGNPPITQGRERELLEAYQKHPRFYVVAGALGFAEATARRALTRAYGAESLRQIRRDWERARARQRLVERRKRTVGAMDEAYAEIQRLRRSEI